MKRLLILSVLLTSLMICGVAFAAGFNADNLPGTYTNETGTIILERLPYEAGQGMEYLITGQSNRMPQCVFKKKAKNRAGMYLFSKEDEWKKYPIKHAHPWGHIIHFEIPESVWGECSQALFGDFTKQE